MPTTVDRHNLIGKLQVHAELARRHFLHYCRFVDRKFLAPPHIKLLAEKLEAVERGDIRRLMIFMPPRHGKSETTSKKFPSWVLGRNPDWNIIMASYSQTLTRSFSRATRDTIESRRYKAVFNVSTAADSRSVNDWNIQGHKGGMLASGVGGAQTGYGAHLFMIDDPVKNQQEAESIVFRDRAWEWYRSVALTRLEPDARMILIMTRWNDDDLAGRILKEEALEGRESEWTIIKLEALCEDPKSDPLKRKKDGALWEGRYDQENLLKTKRKVGTRVWSALYQQKPRDPESQIFRRDWIRWYDELPGGVKIRGGGMDTATSKKETADNTALVDCIRSFDGFLWIDDCMCDKLTVRAAANHVCNEHKTKNYVGIHLEKNNAGEAFAQRIEEIGRETGTYPPVEAVATSTDKVVRAMEFQHLVENGTVRFRRGHQKVKELVDHLINFDGTGSDVDDDVDALGFAIKAAKTAGVAYAGGVGHSTDPD